MAWHGNEATGATSTVAPWEAPTIADTNYAIPSGALFVANSGNDANQGTQAAPLATIAKAISKSHSGTTIVLRGGTYRESLGSVSIAVTLQAYPHEQPWIKGSLVATGFTASGSAWAKQWTSSICDSCYPTGVLDPLYPNAGLPEQVFVNGVPLAQVTSRGAVTHGSFFLDRRANQLWIGSNPNGATVEVTVYDKAIQFNSNASGAAIKGIGIAQYAAHYNSDVPAMVVAGAPNLVIDRSTFVWSASRGVSLYGANDRLTNNTFIDNGMNGVHSYQTSNLFFQHNRVAYNNFERWSILPSVQGSVAAAKMTLAAGGMYADNIFEDNQSNGLWFDTSSSNNTVVNNTFVRNAGHGLDIEVSANTIAAGNVIVANGRDGLKISGSNNVEAWNNTIFGNGWAQLGVYEDPRTNPPAAIRALGVTWDTSNVHIMNNIIVAGPYSSRPVLNSFDLTSPRHATTQSMITSQDHNIWGRTTATGLKYLATVQATLTTNARYNDLPGMQAATHRELASKSVDNMPLSSVFVDLNAGNVRLTTSCPQPSPAQLPSKVAAAMGVGTSPGTIGALKAPIG